MANIEVEGKLSGHRICAEKADDIKKLVSFAVHGFGRVPENIAQVLRQDAADDARLHSQYDPDFQRGGGPAVRPKTNSSEV